MKDCTRCKISKLVSEFSAREGGKPGSWCRSCRREYAAEERRLYPERVRARQAKWLKTHFGDAADAQQRSMLKRCYGMTLETYREMEAKQAGLCLICGTKPEKLNVDHDHKTGKIRGLLCRHCNLVLGHADDDIEVLQKAVKYLLES